ncbi:MAG TPA: ATP-binding SpoIIE family protein phosphatase [Planctomycetota bacterium]
MQDQTQAEVCVPVRSDADIITARQKGRDLATVLGFRATDLTMIVTAISELARNIVQYAHHGEIRLRIERNHALAGLVVVAADQGPGILDVTKALEDGYSTSGSLGLGLPGVKRLMDEFYIKSSLNGGTVVTTKKWRSSSIAQLATGVAACAMQGQAASADRYLVLQRRRDYLLAVIDGVGHGAEAEFASELATRALRESPEGSLESLLALCHARLRATRGVVMSLASIDARQGQLSWIGVGNVNGVLFKNVINARQPARSLVQRGGVVGHTLPPLRGETIGMERGDTLVLATDGVASAFDQEIPLSISAQELADRILARHGRGNDDALVLVARHSGPET